MPEGVYQLRGGTVSHISLQRLTRLVSCPYFAGDERGNPSISYLPTDNVTMKIPGTLPDENSHDHGLGLKGDFSSIHSEPWDIHTGEGCPSSPMGLPHPFGGNNKLVVSGMEKIGDLDPDDVSDGRIFTSPCHLFFTIRVYVVFMTLRNSP